MYIYNFFEENIVMMLFVIRNALFPLVYFSICVPLLIWIFLELGTYCAIICYVGNESMFRQPIECTIVFANNIMT
jgi:hypothetical protein